MGTGLISTGGVKAVRHLGPKFKNCSQSLLGELHVGPLPSAVIAQNHQLQAQGLPGHPPKPCCPPSPCQPLQPQRGRHQVRRDHGAVAGARLAAGPVSVAPAGRRALGSAVLPSQATFQPRWERHKEFCFLPKTQGARSAWRGVCAGLLCLAQGTSSVLPSPGGQLGGSYVPCWALGSAAAELHPDAFWFWDIASLRKRADVIRAKRVEKAQVGSAL